MKDEAYYGSLLQINDTSNVVVHETGLDCNGQPIVLVLEYTRSNSVVHPFHYNKGYIVLDSYIEIKDKYNFQEEIQLLRKNS